jgi:hypothetical protein
MYGEGEHTPPFNAKDKNEWISLSILVIYIIRIWDSPHGIYFDLLFR